MGNYNNYGIEGDWRKLSFLDIKAWKPSYASVIGWSSAATPGTHTRELLEGGLRLGDRLEFRRDAGYAHWGIYVGQYGGMRHAVIHFGMFEGGAAFSKKKTSGSAFSASRKPEIRADTIEQIHGGSGTVMKNNSRDEKVEPEDPDVIIETAKKMHRDETPIDYNLFSSNCEHFVNLCRYSHPHSDQITAAVQKAGYTTLAVGAIGTVLAVATKVISKSQN